MSANYDLICTEYESLRNREFYRRIAGNLSEAMNPLPGQRGLDVACGTGFSTEVLVERFPHVHWSAVDRSSRMIELARAKPALKDVAFAAGQAEELPYADQSMDWVTCNFGLHWFSRTFASETARVLKPGGRLVASVPLLNPRAKTSVNRLLRQALLELRRRPVGVAAGFSEPMLREWFADAASIASLEVEEDFASIDEVIFVLQSRGSLDAIFGSAAWEGARLLSSQASGTTKAPEPLVLHWKVGILSVTFDGLNPSR